MAATPVTDPAILALLNSDQGEKKKPVPVTDPAILAQLEGKSDDKKPDDPTIGDRLRHAGSAIDDSVRAIANGIPFMDRIAAAGGAATGIGGTFGDYSGNLARQRDEDERLQKEAPAANTLAHIAGGALGTLAAAPLAAAGPVSEGAGLLGKTLMGSATGAGIGAVQGVSDAPDLTNLPDVGKRAAYSSLLGAGFGATVPVAGKALGAGYNAIADALMNSDGISRGAAKHLVPALMADGAPAVQQRMGQLGPDAMLADGGFSLQGKATGSALNNDEARSTVFSALKNRDEGTNQRVAADVNRVLGPAEDPVTATANIRARRSEIDNQAYPEALGNAPEVRTAPILTQLDDMIPRSVGMEHRALTNLRDMMMTTEHRPLLDTEGHPQYDRLGHERFEEVPVSQNDAEVLHKIKGELDNVIEYDQPGLGIPAGALTRQQGALKMMRGQLNDTLENQVPGYREANAASAALARRGEAVNQGTQYLGSGKTTPSPARFAAEHAAREPGEQAAFAKGSRGEIDRQLGTKSNDLQALRNELQGQGGWNTAKIATVHGQDAADELVGTVDRNLKFRDTHNKIVENAQTAQRTAAKEAMAPNPPSEMPLITPQTNITGLILSGGKKALNWAYKAAQPDPTRHYGEIADVLTAQGPQRDAHLMALADALSKREQNARIAPTIGNRGALAAALLGGEYLRDRIAKR